MEGSSSVYLPILPKVGSHKDCGSGYDFSLSRDLARPRDYIAMNHGWPLMVSHTPAKFCSHSYHGSLSHDFEKPRDLRVVWFYGWNPLMACHTPAKFGGHKHCGGHVFSL